jgi:hypothetical protein
MRISKTASSTGWGTAPRKFVTHLTPDEKQAIESGETVVMTDCPLDGGNHGSDLRKIVRCADNGEYSLRYTHRMMTTAEIEEADTILGRN